MYGYIYICIYIYRYMYTDGIIVNTYRQLRNCEEHVWTYIGYVWKYEAI